VQASSYKIQIMFNKTAEIEGAWGHDENDCWKASG
jgi:hypothetical protein